MNKLDVIENIIREWGADTYTIKSLGRAVRKYS